MTDYSIYTHIRLVNEGDHPAKGRIHLGLMCINDTLREKDIFCSRSLIRRTFSVHKAKELALQNIKDISKLIIWNNDHDIFNLRISSELFPHFTDTDTEPYTLDFATEELKKIASKIIKK
jgi:UV DNA damage endonuclease